MVSKLETRLLPFTGDEAAMRAELPRFDSSEKPFTREQG